MFQIPKLVQHLELEIAKSSSQTDLLLVKMEQNRKQQLADFILRKCVCCTY